MPDLELSIDVKAEIRTCYDRLADYYWKLTRPEARRYYLDFFRTVASGARVLDAGSGTGLDALALSQMGLQVVAADFSSEMCSLARKRLDAVPSVAVWEGDTENTEQPDGTFAGILSALEIFHHPDLDATLNEYARLLKRDGLLVLVTNHPVRNMLLGDAHDYFDEGLFLEDWGKHGRVPKFHWQFSTYLAALRTAGFRLERIGELPASDDLAAVQDHAISFDGRYPSLLVLVCVK
jgi:ubiquinone/menaquinone biosynthesis C-methylase UbiE